MTPELWWMTWTALLAGALWLPFIVGVNTAAADGHDRTDFTRPGDPARERAWVHRAWRAHLNLLEQFLPMLALVLIARAADISNPITVWASALFFWLRVAHAIGMITGVARFPVRPLLFTAGWFCILVQGAVILTQA